MHIMSEVLAEFLNPKGGLMNEKYVLIDKTTQPEFEYILLTGEYYTEYYLYRSDEFEEAYKQLQTEISNDRHLAVLCGLHFNTAKRDWRAQPLFKCASGKKKIIYDPYQNTMLHLKWYCDAGKWKNPRERWD